MSVDFFFSYTIEVLLKIKTMYLLVFIWTHTHTYIYNIVFLELNNRLFSYQYQCLNRLAQQFSYSNLLFDLVIISHHTHTRAHACSHTHTHEKYLWTWIIHVFFFAMESPILLYVFSLPINSNCFSSFSRCFYAIGLLDTFPGIFPKSVSMQRRF